VICFTLLPPRRLIELPHGKIRKRRKYKGNKGRKGTRFKEEQTEKKKHNITNLAA